MAIFDTQGSSGIVIYEDQLVVSLPAVIISCLTGDAAASGYTALVGVTSLSSVDIALITSAVLAAIRADPLILTVPKFLALK